MSPAVLEPMPRAAQARFLVGLHEREAPRRNVDVRNRAAGLRRRHDDLDDRALAAVAEAGTVFARVDPGQKARLVRSLRAAGHAVGFLGDGVNDAAALRSADVGISVAGATAQPAAAEGGEGGGGLTVRGLPLGKPPYGRITAIDLDSLLRQALDRVSVKEAVAEVAAVTGTPRRDVYQRALALDKERGHGR